MCVIWDAKNPSCDNQSPMPLILFSLLFRVYANVGPMVSNIFGRTHCSMSSLYMFLNLVVILITLSLSPCIKCRVVCRPYFTSQFAQSLTRRRRCLLCAFMLMQHTMDQKKKTKKKKKERERERESDIEQGQLE
jgi:hypothetical protein